MIGSLRAKLLLISLAVAAVPAAVLFLVGRGLLSDLASRGIDPDLRQSLAEAEKYGEVLRQQYAVSVLESAAQLAVDPAIAGPLEKRDAPSLAKYLQPQMSRYGLDFLEVRDASGALLCFFRR